MDNQNNGEKDSSSKLDAVSLMKKPKQPT
jgi:hypothetical protein